MTLLFDIMKTLHKPQSKHVLVIDNSICFYIFNRNDAFEVSRKSLNDYEYAETIFYPNFDAAFDIQEVIPIYLKNALKQDLEIELLEII
jgi:hypothetical protein